MRIGSLFAGIGGLELGLERAGVGRTVWQVEREPYCRRVLARHWPDAQRFDDVRTVGAHNLSPVDVLAGGFPCQDISLAGRGAGLEGERSGLFYEVIRLVRELGPRFVVLENVDALLVRGLDSVLGSLADCGYDAVWSRLSSARVGGWHRRRRVFVIAYDQRARTAVDVRGGGQAGSLRLQAAQPSGGDLQAFDRGRLSRPLDGCGAPPLLCRGDDGVPHRVDRVRACGNAVDPRVAEVVGRVLVDLANRLDATEPAR